MTQSDALRMVVAKMEAYCDENEGGVAWCPPEKVRGWVNEIKFVTGLDRREPRISLSAADEVGRAEACGRDPCLEKRNAHPLVQELNARRQRAVDTMFEVLGACIKSDGRSDEFHEESRSHWGDRFFRAAAEDGIVIDGKFRFCPAGLQFPLTPGLTCRVELGPMEFADCAPLPVEVELMHDIPSEKP